MSAETTANAIVLKFLGRIQAAGRESIPEGSVRWLRDAIRDALTTAADKEREACGDRRCHPRPGQQQSTRSRVRGITDSRALTAHPFDPGRGEGGRKEKEKRTRNTRFTTRGAR